MDKKGVGIRFQLISGMVIMTIAGIGLIGVLSVKIVERSALFWKIDQAGDMVRVIRASMRPSNGGTAQGARYAETAFRESGVRDFIVTGPGNNPLIRGGVLPADKGERVFASEELEAYRYGGGLLRAGELLRITAPLPSFEGGTGRVEFTLGLNGISEEMSGIRKFLIVYALLDSIIIISFGVYFLSRLIIKPLKKLEEAATRIAGGKLCERAEVSADNEVGSLANSFNSMAERLEDEIKSLERVNLDLTTAQEEVLRSSTLAAVGSLAAGIAHEIGNPLGAVRGYMDLLSRGGLDKDEEKEIIERASAEAARIDNIVREFLDVARPSKKSAADVDVNRLLSETLPAVSVRPEFEGVRAVFEPDGSLPAVMIDGGKLRQVFVNLLINAAQSMMEGSEEKVITISSSAARRPIEQRMGRRKDDLPVDTGPPWREFVSISFRDTGSGITEEDAGKIFDPFFTTKAVGSGTGLGLFVSQSIIKAYGGQIDFSSKPGEGSVFTVLLPAGARP